MLRNTDLLILDLKKPSMVNQATWGKSSSKEEKKFNQLWQGIQQLRETMLIQNEKLDKLTNITQNLENKLNGIQKRWLNMKIS